MHDGGTRFAVQEPVRDDRGDGAPGERLQPVVDEEGAVGITIEGNAEVVSAGAHQRLEVSQVLRPQRVGMVVGERAVGFEIERIEGHGQTLEDRGHGHARYTVAAVGGDPKSADRIHVDDRGHVVDVARKQVALGDRAGPPPGRHACRGEIANFVQATVAADRGGTGQAQLDPVVTLGVVRRRDHRPRLIQRPCRVVDHVGGDHPEIVHVDTGRGDPLNQCRRKLG